MKTYKLATLTFKRCINAGLPKRSDSNSYHRDQNVVAIGVSYTLNCTIDKNGNSVSCFQRVRTSGLEQSTRIRAIVRLF